MNTTKHEGHSAVAGQVDCRVRPQVEDVMRLGDTERFEVWFLPTNREGYAPRMLADGMEGVAVAREFIAAWGGRYHGTLEVVRTVTRRQRIAA